MDCKHPDPGPTGPPHRPTGLRRLALMLRRFGSDTSGAVTVDFVVLTAAVVSLGVSAGIAITEGVETSTERSQKCMKIIEKQLFKKNLTATQAAKRINKQCKKL